MLSKNATKIFNKAVKNWATGKQLNRLAAMDTMVHHFVNTQEQASLALELANEFPTWTPEFVLKYVGVKV